MQNFYGWCLIIKSPHVPTGKPRDWVGEEGGNAPQMSVVKSFLGDDKYSATSPAR